ncbi:siderophore-interacting protein [Chitinophaga nivalis]|uniref:Siderophore-interacting protein n=1 Tax=Chitinophaga nivalis TaxID=2991709 RepID=A0ABT3IKP3_9BACT|nr:siderophore-interacting protein [Chitinophaga nivalis]MCW3465772.1 siderophore-interacting protein [Chitinophaga nivalis]MCW3484537.1 siderophore-interacting protein [Chitinophaga nivalis]
MHQENIPTIQAAQNFYAHAAVTAIKDVSPHLRRFTFKAYGLKAVHFCRPGNHIKIFIPQPGSAEIALPDVSSGRPNWPDPTQKPVMRTYTLRKIDPGKEELDIEFALHDDNNGAACAWAMLAKPGDLLGIGMKAGKTLREADWYFMGGDETAIPAIAAMLESLPATATGMAYLEVDTPADTFEIITRSAVQIRWLYRNGTRPEASRLLLQALQSAPLPAAAVSTRYVWVSAEAEVVKAVKQYAKNELLLQREELHATVYWKAGESEDEYQREK